MSLKNSHNSKQPNSTTRRFVIHKHAARSLHYDFRLEDQGVLKSWAIPKGPSLDPHKKQLAIQTEDHLLSYGSFEGILPEGSYGAGPVIIWDEGTYSLLKDLTFSESEKGGEILIHLVGKKLQGDFALIKMHLKRNKSWLLIKMNDDYARPDSHITNDEPRSVVSGKTIEELTVEGRHG